MKYSTLSLTLEKSPNALSLFRQFKNRILSIQSIDSLTLKRWDLVFGKALKSLFETNILYATADLEGKDHHNVEKFRATKYLQHS